MTVCNWILSPIIALVRTLVRTVREVVRTVCEWVSTIIRTVREVVERICRSLPWPLSALCNLVTRLIEVVETVWDWVCREVIDRIIRWIEVVLEYVYYILRWVCWAIDWAFRLPELLLCLIGLTPRKFMRVCVKILTDAEGNPAIAVADVQNMMRDAAAILERCNIRLILNSTELVRKEEFLEGTTCNFGGMFSDFFLWFSERACQFPSAVTVYFVRDIDEASGCAYPGTNWVTVDEDGDGTTVVQEIGHLADLWSHSSDPDNVMTDQRDPGGTHDQITRWQCCMIRTSRFVSIVPPLELTGLTATGELEATLAPVERAFRRKEGSPESKPQGQSGR